MQLGIKVVHVPREQNIMADKLANWRVGGSSIFIGNLFPLGFK